MSAWGPLSLGGGGEPRSGVALAWGFLGLGGVIGLGKPWAWGTPEVVTDAVKNEEGPRVRHIRIGCKAPLGLVLFYFFLGFQFIVLVDASVIMT